MTTDIRDLCNIKYLVLPQNFKPDPNNKVDVFSTSLFRTHIGGYKNFKQYIKGLKQTARYLSKRMPHFYFLLYIDDTIYKSELFDVIKRLDNKKLIIAHYSCPIGLHDDPEHGHIDLFGTMVRFIPMFEHDQNFTRHVICIDADNKHQDMLNILDDYEMFVNISSQFHFDTNTFYELFSRWVSSDFFSVLAGRQMSKYKFPLHLMIDFLKHTRFSRDPPPSAPKTSLEDIFSYEKYKTWPYGFDEYFLNWVVLAYVHKNKITYSVSSRYAITAPFYMVNLDSLIEPGSELESKLVKDMRIILDLDPNRSYTAMDVLIMFDDYFSAMYNGVTVFSPKAHAVARRYYQYIENLYRNEDYSIFPEAVLVKILKSKMYIMRKVFIIYYKTHARYYMHPNYILVENE